MFTSLRTLEIQIKITMRDLFLHSPDWQTSKRTIISAVNRDCEEEVEPHTLLPGIGMEQNSGSKQAMPINIQST